MNLVCRKTPHSQGIVTSYHFKKFTDALSPIHGPLIKNLLPENNLSQRGEFRILALSLSSYILNWKTFCLYSNPNTEAAIPLDHLRLWTCPTSLLAHGSLMVEPCHLGSISFSQNPMFSNSFSSSLRAKNSASLYRFKKCPISESTTVAKKCSDHHAYFS